MVALEQTASKLISASLTKSTQQSYNSTLSEFHSFIRSLGSDYYSPTPNSGHIILFIAHLYHKGSSSSTITTKLSAINYYFKLRGLPDPSNDFLISKALTGVRKLSPTCDQRLPITIPILHRLMELCPVTCKSDFHILLLQAMMSVSFYGFLRPGEITKSPHNLQVDQVSVSQSKISILFKSFKHHTGRSVTVEIPKQQGFTCPVRALRAYLQSRGTSPGPLFCNPSHLPVSYAQYHDWFIDLMALSRIPGKFNTHSFRIGAATWAASRGVSHTLIQQMGRWQSSAFLKYIRLSVVRT